MKSFVQHFALANGKKPNGVYCQEFIQEGFIYPQCRLLFSAENNGQKPVALYMMDCD